MIKCRECGQDVSTEAKLCPHCGVQSPAIKEWKGTGLDWKAGPLFYGYPLIHVALGRDAKGKQRVAKGIIAIGQFAIGLITIAQFGVGVIFGFGQFIIGGIAIAQIAVGALFGLGQLATGYIAIGQLVLGFYGFAQMGFAKYIWTPDHKDIQAIEFFRQLLDKVKNIIHIN